MTEWMVVFERGSWAVYRRIGQGGAAYVADAPSFEAAVMEIAIRNGGGVGIKIVTPG